jgi:hypothetical protein
MSQSAIASQLYPSRKGLLALENVPMLQLHNRRRTELWPSGIYLANGFRALAQLNQLLGHA